MNHPDLFGGETEVKEKQPVTKISEWIRIAHYRPAENKVERCKNCIHCFRFKQSKAWHKCELFGMSHSGATDIKLNFVCDNYLRVG